MRLAQTRIVSVLALLLAHLLFWFGVLYWALIMAHGTVVRYEAPVQFATLFRNLPLLEFSEVVRATPPILTPLLIAGTLVTLYAVFSGRRSTLTGALLIIVCALLCLPALLGVVSFVFMPLNLAVGQLHGESVSERWFQDAGIAILFVTSLALAIRHLREVAASRPASSR